MSTTSPIDKVATVPSETMPDGELREQKIARYTSPEFTKTLTEAFHRAKRHAIQADREVAEKTGEAASGS